MWVKVIPFIKEIFFNAGMQLPRESFDAYYAVLRSLASWCRFVYQATDADNKFLMNELLGDCIVLGVCDDNLRQD